MDDRETLKKELIPLEWPEALVASSATVGIHDGKGGTEPREEIIAWIMEQLHRLPLGYLYQVRGFVRGFPK